MFAKNLIKYLLDTYEKSYVHRTVAKYKFKGRVRYCPVCNNYVSNFLPFGSVRRDARCPICFSLERGRLVWLFFKEWTNLFDDQVKKMLHVAPEHEFKRLLKKEKSIDYLSADLDAPNVMVRMDIMNIEYPEDTFDIVFCSHVLEHVADDIKAMHEFHRVLNPDGWAVLQVPITTDRTFEDPNIIDPEERLRLFGERNHLRRYGTDYVERLSASGFIVESIPSPLVVGTENMSLMSIDKNESIYFCTKTPNKALEKVRERVTQLLSC